MEERLQKILAAAGIASRRKVEELIREHRVTVNGKVAELGDKADPQKDHIKLDGKLVTSSEPKIYILMNKPRGVITSVTDPEGRPTVMDMIPGVKVRVFPVGRLDFHSEGLLILTNDGELANKLMHPSSKLPKTYIVKVKEPLGESEIELLRNGVYLDDGKTAPAVVNKVKRATGEWIEITIHEGRNRQVRRMFERVGHLPQRLKRVSIGPIKIGNMKASETRIMTEEEVSALRKAVGAQRAGRNKTK
ncbi:MAG: rRNA pseudouridine synthase [Nitrospirae bacterium]|nr:rRNA pseudouridine synthase [Nitrospirota bacterium]